jgi:hypothetical protein
MLFYTLGVITLKLKYYKTSQYVFSFCLLRWEAKKLEVEKSKVTTKYLRVPSSSVSNIIRKRIPKDT